jgi:uncharacterized membrane protein
MGDIDAVEDIPLFSQMPSEQLDVLARSAERRIYEAGDAIFRQGDMPEFLYAVESGAVEIVLPTRGEEIILASFEAGSFFGELGLFDSQRRTANARATARTSLLCVPLAVIASLVDRHPATARHFMGVIIQRLRSADELLSRLQIRNVNDLVDARMTFGERVADMVARFGGSWTFIICFGVFLAAWMAVNSVFLLARAPDPYPYIFLNLILSCIAALQAPIIMMSQNRQDKKDRLRGELDYDVNRRAETEIQGLAHKINLIGDKIGDVEDLLRHRIEN